MLKILFGQKIHNPREKRFGNRSRTKDEVWQSIVDNSIVLPSGCWMYRGAAADDKGYTKVCFNGKWIRTTHFSWEYHFGTTLPPELFACHKCDNPGCYNPFHLFPGTPWENQLDAISKGRMWHPNGNHFDHAKLNPNQVVDIRKEYFSIRTSQSKLAKRYGVSKTAIRKVLKRRSWKHIK